MNLTARTSSGSGIKMERPLEKHLDETFKIPGVSGVLCADENGLCLGAKGVAKKEAAGHITSIALSAAKLIPKSNTNPVICIEGETGSVLIKKEENIVMAVYKSQA